MPKDNACTDKGVDSGWEKLLVVLDAIQVAFPGSDDALVHLFGTAESKSHLSNSAQKDTTPTLPAAENTDLVRKRFSLWMLQRIIINWINNQPGSALKRLLKCLLSSSRYYSKACAYILNTITDGTKATLIDKLLLRICIITDAPPILSESSLCSRYLVDFFAESSEGARLYFQIDTRLVCLQLRYPSKRETNMFSIFMLDCSKKGGEPWRWQGVTEVQYLAGDQVHCPKLFDTIHVKCISKASCDTKLYEIALVLCTDTSVYIIILVLSISTSLTIHGTPHVHKSHSTAGFLATLFDRQGECAKKASVLLDFFYVADTAHEHPYVCILSPFLPLLFAVSGRFLESFFLERGDGGCTVLGVLITTGRDPIIVTAEGKAHRISVVCQQDCKSMPHIRTEEIQSISSNSSPWTVAITPCSTAVILERGRVLIADQDGTQIPIIERHLCEDVSNKHCNDILDALVLLKSTEAPLIHRILSIGLLRISVTLVYVVAIGRRWDGKGFLAVYDTIKWSIRLYNTVFSVSYLRGRKRLSRWTLLNNSLLCGPH